VGLAAEREIKAAADTISRLLRVHEYSLVFTSGGTEANNAAILSAAKAVRNRRGRLITTKAEHPSVAEAHKALEQRGFDVIYLNLSENGAVDADELSNAVNDDTLLVSIAHVNSETGVIQPIGDLVKIVKDKNPAALFHCDAVQSFGKLDINDFVRESGVDTAAFSSHKIHGLKGTGCLYVRRGEAFTPLIMGGGQQRRMRSGTEDTAGIVAFAAAAEEAFSKMQSNDKKVAEIKNIIINGISDIGLGIEINGGVISPYILNFSIPSVKSEVLLHALDAAGICVSAGTACSRKAKSSPTITAYGLPKWRAEGALRLSFSAANTAGEARFFLEKIGEILPRLAKTGGKFK